jgi:hypothetical protein
MLNLLLLLLIAGLIIYLIGYLFFRSLLWVIEPLIEYFEKKKALSEEQREEDL